MQINHKLQLSWIHWMFCKLQKKCLLMHDIFLELTKFRGCAINIFTKRHIRIVLISKATSKLFSVILMAKILSCYLHMTLNKLNTEVIY